MPTDLMMISSIDREDIGEKYTLIVKKNGEAWINSTFQGHDYFLALPFDVLKELIRILK